jgi:predicted 2-oxoglutarate/Fe(II)-dependent dioxygenase YbiX
MITMLLQVPNVLIQEQVAECRRQLDVADWIDGRVTAGHQSARAKDNTQLAEDSPISRQLGQLILAALAIQRLGRDVPGHASVVQLTGIYHNLLRQWSDV